MILTRATLLIAFSSLAAQAAEPVVPDAGSILQQVQPAMPPSPSSTGTGLTIEQEGGGKLPPSAPFMIAALQISGSTLFDTMTLRALVAGAEGQSLTLPQLDEWVARITDYYHSHGYPLARAFIPAQTIQAGIVRIEIIEARYGKIGLDNRSRVKNALLQATLSPLQSGQAINQMGLDHALLLLSDIPGVVINATLKPGVSAATSDLLLEAASGPSVAGSMALDSYGNRYTGRTRAGGTVNFINPLHHGDVLSLSGLSSGSGMNYVRISYDTLLNGKGSRIGGSYSALHYVLGDTLTSINGHGTAEVGSLWAKHPLLRSRDANLYAQIQYEQVQLRDHIEASAIRTDRHLENWTGSLIGDTRHAIGINTWNLGLTTGRVDFDDGAAQLADAASARTQGSFTKWNASLARLQSLDPQNALYLNFTAQGANGNLDSSQKMTAGGPYTVRAYDMGAVSGDAGYEFSAEYRHDLKSVWHGQWQAVAFIDSAHVLVNKSSWSAGANSATLTGAGAGLNWTGAKQWNARAYVATPVGATPALVASSASVRAWIEIGRGF